jgi:hypothetical protein
MVFLGSESAIEAAAPAEVLEAIAPIPILSNTGHK